MLKYYVLSRKTGKTGKSGVPAKITGLTGFTGENIYSYVYANIFYSSGQIPKKARFYPTKWGDSCKNPLFLWASSHTDFSPYPICPHPPKITGKSGNGPVTSELNYDITGPICAPVRIPVRVAQSPRISATTRPTPPHLSSLPYLAGPPEPGQPTASRILLPSASRLPLSPYP